MIEPSLSQLVVSIKKKLSLDNESIIVLAQVRGDRRIDLEDGELSTRPNNTCI